MKKVIVMVDEEYRLLGVAEDYKHAVNVLMDNHFLEFNCCHAKGGLTFNEYGITLEDVQKMSIEEFNELFCEYFELTTEEVL